MRTAYCASKAATNLFFQSLELEEDDVVFSVMIPDSFSGSNFRNNSLIQGAELEDRKKISVQEVADIVIGSADRRSRLTYVPAKTGLMVSINNSANFLAPNFRRNLINKV